MNWKIPYQANWDATAAHASMAHWEGAILVSRTPNIQVVSNCFHVWHLSDNAGGWFILYQEGPCLTGPWATGTLVRKGICLFIMLVSPGQCPSMNEVDFVNMIASLIFLKIFRNNAQPIHPPLSPTCKNDGYWDRSFWVIRVGGCLKTQEAIWFLKGEGVTKSKQWSLDKCQTIWCLSV